MYECENLCKSLKQLQRSKQDTYLIPAGRLMVDEINHEHWMLLKNFRVHRCAQCVNSDHRLYSEDSAYPVRYHLLGE